ncbi:MAG: hypothetical protein JXB29_13125 [Sedimentisphaerales bacterium]|nr:hypothetical protein [Sedimentisphaerales bacterium]
MAKRKIILVLVFVVTGLAGSAFADEGIEPTVDLVGSWCGGAKVPDIWFGRVNLSVSMVIDEDGEVNGKVGDAELYDGVLKKDKIAWIGKQRLWGSEYVVEGKLRGAINAEAGIKRKTVRVLFDYDETEDRLEGGVFSSGWILGAKKTGQVIGRKMELKRVNSNNTNSAISEPNAADSNEPSVAMQTLELKIGEKSNNSKIRVGIYDSRAVAIAFAYSEFNGIDAKMAEMEKAKADGDTKKIAELQAWGPAQQARLHRQGFSTTPVDDILEHIRDELPQIAKDANVTTLVSKWDKKTLKRYRSAELIDVTDLIVAPFNPDEKQLKAIEQLKKKKPIPLWQLEIMMKLHSH